MATTERTRNTRLACAVSDSGLTYGAIAREVRRVAAENGTALRTNASAIAHWVAGTTPSPATAVYLAEALSRRSRRPVSVADLGLSCGYQERQWAIGDPVRAVAELGGADVERREFLSSVVFSLGALALPLREESSSRVVRAAAGGRCGPGDIEVVQQVTTAFTQYDERLGGGHARSAVVEYLRTDAAAYCRAGFTRDTDRRAMFGAVAELVYLAGWKSHDAGLDGLAQRYYLASYDLAMEADPAGHAAYVLRILAHQAMDLGHHQHCADLAAEALTRVAGRVDPQTESLFWLTAARAHASGDDRHDMLTSIATAEQLIGRDHGDPGPRWASLGGPAQARFTNQAGQALRTASDHAGAERQLAQSASCWDPATHPRPDPRRCGGDPVRPRQSRTSMPDLEHRTGRDGRRSLGPGPQGHHWYALTAGLYPRTPRRDSAHAARRGNTEGMNMVGRHRPTRTTVVDPAQLDGGGLTTAPAHHTVWFSTADGPSDISRPWYEHGFARVGVPMLGRADSLNVAVSASVLLYEARARKNDWCTESDRALT